MRFDILTLFPEMFDSPFNASLLKKARERELIDIRITDIRDFALNKHRTADDYPYGGGSGMVMKIEPIAGALESLDPPITEGGLVCLLTPQGEVFNQKTAREFAGESRIVLICGHYEGVDERVRDHLVHREISIGDFVLTGGELPAMVVVDAVSRLVSGVLGNEQSAEGDSFAVEQGLLEYPQYTRPAEFRGWTVPEVLLSGHHAEIEAWRRKEALKRTFLRRPDLLKKAHLTDEDRAFLELWLARPESK
ncbi:MAG: tRNA (guanosine(37)-N1)-methyltransferase TrmD [Syntrophaceae bacterium]